MKYCSKCGKELVDEAVICTNCGCSVAQTNATPAYVEEDKISVGFCILAFLVPLFGLIYWAVKRSDTPRRAKAIGITALVSFILNIISSVLLIPVLSAIFAAILSEEGVAALATFAGIL